MPRAGEKEINMIRTILVGWAITLVAVSGCVDNAAGLKPPASGKYANVIQSGWMMQDIAKVTEAGETISSPAYSPNNWYVATVPGTVLTTLVNNKVYPEPLYGENNRPNIIPESLCRTSYWYRTTCNIPSITPGEHLWLNFEGINYIAEVWVNGRLAGEVRGAFSRGIFDITSLVQVNGKATLAVLIKPPLNPGDPAEQTVSAGVGGNGGVLAADGPTFLASIGWDWMPAIRDRNMGIWQNVHLSKTGPVKIVDPLVTTDLPLPRTDEASIAIALTLQNLTDSPQEGILHCVIEKIAIDLPVKLKPNESQKILVSPETHPQLRMRNPRLWWPNGLGDPNLYSLNLRFEIGKTASDTRDVTFGVREIEYQLPGSENLAIIVNGVPVMCKGGNWGMDEAMKRIPRSRLEDQIRLHKLANYNMIRNWVGQSTSEDFYDLCDRYGLMVWDEFFQPNPSDGPNPRDVALYLANVREKVLRYRNHPSIVLWCGRNEGNPPPEIDAGIRQIMQELESVRVYHPNSRDGRGVRSGGPYAWRPPEQFYNFNQNEAFKTELGAASIPTLESIHAMMPEKDWEPMNDDWASHDLARGNGRGDQYMTAIGNRFGTTLNLADFVRKAQLANYEAWRAMYEGRFAKMFNPSTGVLAWMSNPAQPSFMWQIYSHDLETMATFFAVKKACEPVHIQVNMNDWHIMVINHTPAEINGLKATIKIFNMDATLKAAAAMDVSAKTSGVTDLGPIAFPDDLSPVHFVKLELLNAKGQIISENFYWRPVAGQPSNLQPLQLMPKVTLEASGIRRDTRDMCIIDVTIKNPTKSMALMTHLQLRNAANNQRVLPAIYSDNYLSLLPGEHRIIRIEARKSSLSGGEPLIAIDGWNVTDTDTHGGVRIIPNPPAHAFPASVPTTSN
jgi:beta-mannosidase